METTLSLSNHFLIAMPSLRDENFYHSVMYICEHNQHGAIGIVVNRPLSMSLGDVLAGMDIDYSDASLAEKPILFGGPVYPERGFVIHRPAGEWRATLVDANDIAITTSRDVLQALGAGKGPSDFLVCLGCVGWEAGQLEQELIDNLWLSCPANAEILFTIPPHERWSAAAKLLGIDINQLSSDIGHA